MVEISRLQQGDTCPEGKARELEDDHARHGQGKTAVYCRVSSHEQKTKGDLERQVDVAREHCHLAGMAEPLVFTDVGSGLSVKRSGLARLCKAIEQGVIGTVVVTFKDRLTRFGFGYLDRYFQSYGASIVVARRRPTMTMHEELVEDLVAIVTSFSGRMHGMRGRKRCKQSTIDIEARTMASMIKKENKKAIDAAVRAILAGR